MALPQGRVIHGPANVDYLLHQLKEDEQRLIRLRQMQNTVGTLGANVARSATVAAKPYDFLLPGDSPRQQIDRSDLPTPPQRRGLAVGQHGNAVRVPPTCPALSGQQQAALAAKRLLPYGITTTTTSTEEVIRVPTPRATTPRQQAQDGEVPVERSDCFSNSRCSSRSSQRCASSAGGADTARIERLEQMLVEERVGRLEMLEKVNALSQLLIEQNSKLRGGVKATRRRGR